MIKWARTTDGQVQLTVEDKGKGFAPAKSAEGRSAGESFGLSSIRERLDLLGGLFLVDSASGEGTRITLVLPVAVAGPAATTVSDPPSAPAVARGWTGAIRVIVADDHDLVRKGLVALLSAELGVEVVGEAADGGTALELARQLRPELVLMDVNMPVMDGVESTRRLAAEMPDTKVVGLSMHVDAAIREKMLAAGATAYLTKDSAGPELIATIRECCGARADG